MHHVMQTQRLGYGEPCSICVLLRLTSPPSLLYLAMPRSTANRPLKKF